MVNVRLVSSTILFITNSCYQNIKKPDPSEFERTKDNCLSFLQYNITETLLIQLLQLKVLVKVKSLKYQFLGFEEDPRRGVVGVHFDKLTYKLLINLKQLISINTK